MTQRRDRRFLRFCRLPYRWIFRLLIGAVVVNVLLRYRLGNPSQPSYGLRSLTAGRCTPYSPALAAGLFRVYGHTFNFTEPPSGLFAGTGVVIAASGKIMRQAAGALVTAYVIREVLGSDIPIEVYYSGPDEAFEGPVKAALEALSNIRLLDLQEALNTHRTTWSSFPPTPPLKTLQGYAAKVYSVLASSFREAILIDAGAVLFVKPDWLLTLPSYRQHHMAIFSDYVYITKKRWAPVVKDMCLDYGNVRRAFGGRELDSSCVVLDKVANYDALAVGLALNNELQHFVYNSLVGDKDTWGLAMLYVGKSFSIGKLEPGYLLIERDFKNRARKVTGHLQFLKDPSVPATGLVPIHHNNQMLDFREFPFVQNKTYVETFSRLGDVLMPNKRRDCRNFPTHELMRLPERVQEVFLAVAEGLQMAGIDHCVCRDDWISCEEDIIRLRKRYFLLRVLDALITPRHTRRRKD